MWEIELRARIGALRIPLWRTTEQETVGPVVDKLKQRLKQARMARSLSVRQLGASWLHLLDALENRLQKLQEERREQTVSQSQELEWRGLWPPTADQYIRPQAQDEQEARADV